MKSLFAGIKNTLIWSYARGTWQYDLLCALIIATVFLVPSRYFGDRDRTQVLDPHPISAKHDAARLAHSEPLLIGKQDLIRFLEKDNRPVELDKGLREALQEFLQRERSVKGEVVHVEKALGPDGHEVYRVWVKS